MGTKRPGLLLIILLVPLLLHTQSLAQRLSVTINKPPAPGDSIEISVAVQRVSVAMITPAGLRITAENANANGFEWFARLNAERVGDQKIQIVFDKPGLAGRYVLQFTPPSPKTISQGDVRLVSRLADYEEVLRAIPGAQMQSAPIVDGAADIPIDMQIALPKDAAAFFDIVTPSRADSVTLTLPSGRILRPGASDQGQNTWRIFDERFPKSEAGMLSFSVPPIDGVHNLVVPPDAGMGRYVVHVESQALNQRVIVAVARRPDKAWTDRLMGLTKLREGEVGIQPQRLPGECFAGDKLDVAIKLAGDVGSAAPKFVFRIQTSPPVSPAEAGMRYADLGPIQTLPADLVLGPDGTWRGRVLLDKPGMSYVSLRVTGATDSGKPFTAESLLTDSYMIVHPIVARLLSVTANAINANGDKRFDRLDIVAQLDVSYPGDYGFGVSIRNAAGQRFARASSKINLTRGRQTLTISVPAKDVWRDFRDGPFEIFDVWVIRTENLYAVKVPPSNVEVRTAAWKRDQWDPGPVFGEDTVTVQGIRPAQSGRFRFVEIQWRVTTSGGPCSWYATLTGGPAMGFNQLAYQGSLPRGQATLSFVWGGALIATAPKLDNWQFDPSIRCGSDSIRGPHETVALDPKQYEPAQMSFSIHARNPIRLAAGSSGTASIYVLEKRTEQVNFDVGKVPEGLEAALSLPKQPLKTAQANVVVRALPDSKPGRYVIDISAESGAETARSELLVDVVGN